MTAMSSTPQEFWAALGLGRRRNARRRDRPRRARINLVMWEGAINRGGRGYRFPADAADDTTGLHYGSASVVRGLPGRAAVSTIRWDPERARLRARFIGQHGREYQTVCDAYADTHYSETKPAVVIAVDSCGTVLYSRDFAL